jgi:hypothetical protein
MTLCVGISIDMTDDWMSNMLDDEESVGITDESRGIFNEAVSLDDIADINTVLG